MGDTHLSGPLYVGGKRLTSNAAITPLTNQIGGTPDNTIQSPPSASGDDGGTASVSSAANVATVASVNAALDVIRADLSDLTAKVNTILGALQNAGIIN